MAEGYFLDIERWKRNSIYNFFKNYDLPYFNICADIEVTNTLNWCRENNKPFSKACWYICQRVINHIEEFRYRINDGKIWVHDRINITTTILKEDETFRFCFYPYAENFEQYISQAIEAENDIHLQEEKYLDERMFYDSVIHGTTLPWVKFTSVQHPRSFSRIDSVPKITFGRFEEQDGTAKMPVSVEAHHALMDGIHASRFFQYMEEEMKIPEKILVEN